MNKGEGSLSVSILFGVSFIMLVAAALLYIRREDNDFAKFKAASEAMQKEVESVSKKLDEMREENKRLRLDIEAAHGQADAAKSKAETAETLAHKVALDAIKRPAQSLSAHLPVKVEPIRVVIYDKRDLQRATKKVKEAEKQKGDKQKPLSN